VVLIVVAMTPRRAAFWQCLDGGFYFVLPGRRRRTNGSALGFEGSGERFAGGLKFFDLGFAEGVATHVKTADRPAAQGHANRPANPLGPLQAPKSVPVVLVVLALKVLAVNSAPPVSAVRQCDHGRGSGSEGATCSKKGQNSTRGKHSKPPVVEFARRRRFAGHRPGSGVGTPAG
jgi:hypothetical protein